MGYKALMYHGNKDIRIGEVAQPKECKPSEVRLEIAYCGLCGSDIHEYMGGPIFPPKPGCKHPYTGSELPVVMGHEFSGTVIEVGSDVKDVKVGQKAAVNPALNETHYGMDKCTPCKLGKPNLCKRIAYYGLSAGGGGLAKEIVIAASNLIPLPDNVSLKVGALAEPLAVAWHSIRTSGFQKGQTALVLGAGPIGLAILMLLDKVWEAKSCIVSEVTGARAAQAKKFGATRVVNPLEKIATTADSDSAADAVLQAVQELDPDGVDVAFDCTGMQSTLDTSIEATKPAGIIFNVAIHEKPLLINLNDISCTEKKLLGGICYVREDFDGVMRALANGLIPAEEMITSVVPLSNAIKGGFHELMENKAKHVKILIQPD